MSQFNLPELELEILKYWNEENIFKLTLEESKNRPIFNFYDGPPFANGSPHYGHLLASTIKDTICRFQTINGHYVPRINGFDVHGLPVEQLGEKVLGIKKTEEIYQMGIDKFNQCCREQVNNSAKSWEEVIPRMGRWIDFENGYKTMDFEFMNAVLGVFKTIFDKGLVYRSLTPMPFSTGCGSCLSHFEAKSNYQDTQDPSIVVKFPILDNDFLTNLKINKISFLVWTTTPYSLTSNMALCINSKLIYCLVKVILESENKENKEEYFEYFIIAKEAIKTWENKNKKFIVLMELESKSLIGLKYQPPFNYLSNNININLENINNKIFTVLDDPYVKVETGTGIVHLAPGMGEDDFRVCLRENIIDLKRPESIFCPIDEKGCLTVDNLEMENLNLNLNLKGDYVKVADKKIIKYLKEDNINLLFEAKTITHSYPFCYRTDTPLIQKSISAWFIDVHSINDKILELNKKINWVPSSVGTSRFEQWLSTPKDWSFGRNRFWGTPVPLWVNEDFSEIVCIGSVIELEKLAGLEEGSIKDLHREFIDNIKIPSKKNPNQFLTRINDVFDCWFESGSMPYGKFAVEQKLSKSQIYDLLKGDKKEKDKEMLNEFLKYFPADFIGEGLDQTRGWFYTLLVISTILFEETSYKNVIVNGLILAADPTQINNNNTNVKWIKMSKRHKNYPNPEEVLNKYGADSLRLYLLDSCATHGEPLKFNEEGLQQKGKFLVQLFNCFQFLEAEIKLFQQNQIQKENHQGNLKFKLVNSTQIYDQWILGKLNETLNKSIKYYQEYKLYLVVPILIEFEELFSKWYINLAKENMKGFNGINNQQQSLSTLWIVLRTFAIIISPITPFMSEKLYLELNELIDFKNDINFNLNSISSSTLEENKNDLNLNFKKEKTVHLELLESYLTKFKFNFNEEIAEKVSCMVDVVIAVRGLKSGGGISSRMKSKELILKHPKQEFLNNIKELEKELLTVVKIDKIVYELLNLEEQTDLIVKFNSQNLGRLVKKDLQKVQEILNKLPPSHFLDKDYIECCGYKITSDLWNIQPQIIKEKKENQEKENLNLNYLTEYTRNGLLVNLSKEILTSYLEDQLDLLIKNIQKAKKEANIKAFQNVKINVYINENEMNLEFKKLVIEELEMIQERLRSPINLIDFNKELNNEVKIIKDYQNDFYSFIIFE